jgi:hypothetical protein
MTMEIYKVDGKQIYAGRSWVAADGTQHPKTWVRWSDEEKKAAGISTVVLQPFPDQRLYASSHNDDGSVASSARALDGEHGVKATLIAEVKSQQGALLALTDWQIIRKADAGAGTDIDAKVQSWRNAIRAKADASETAITNAANTAALATLLGGTLFDWPELDD